MTPTESLTIQTFLCGFVAVVLVIICGVQEKRRYSIVFLLVYLIIILFLTLISRIVKPQAIREVNIDILWSYRKWERVEVRCQVLQNVFLFIPYGALLKVNKIKYPVALAFATTVLIEVLQFILALGYAELADIVHNTLGAGLGIIILDFTNKFFWNRTKE